VSLGIDLQTPNIFDEVISPQVLSALIPQKEILSCVGQIRQPCFVLQLYRQFFTTRLDQQIQMHALATFHNLLLQPNACCWIV